MVIFLLIWAFINILGFLKRDSKIIFIIQMIFIWILFGWNSGGMDYAANEAIFDYSGRKSFSGITSGWLYSLMAHFCHTNGYTFIVFNIITGAIMVSALVYVILKLTNYPCLVAIFFTIYPLMDSVIQKRYAVGMALLVLALYFLKKDNKILFLIFEFCAFGFHFSFLIFILLAFWKYIKRKNMVIGIGLVLELFVILAGRNFLSYFFSTSKLDEYLYTQSYSSVFVAICFMIVQMIYFILFYKVYKIDSITDNRIKDNDGAYIWQLNQLVILLVPLCYAESAFMRYYRIILIFNYIYLANKFGRFKSSSNHVYLYKKNYWAYLFVIYTVIINVFLYNAGAFGFSGFWDTLMNNAFFNIVN